jgi:hypothetical protein
LAIDILQKYDILEQIFCITTQNASNNGTMPKVLEKKLGEFKADKHMLGCGGCN